MYIYVMYIYVYTYVNIYKYKSMVDYLLSVLRTRIIMNPAMVAAAMPRPAFHQTTESPCINPNCFICLQ